MQVTITATIDNDKVTSDDLAHHLRDVLATPSPHQVRSHTEDVETQSVAFSDVTVALGDSR